MVLPLKPLERLLKQMPSQEEEVVGRLLRGCGGLGETPQGERIEGRGVAGRRRRRWWWWVLRKTKVAQMIQGGAEKKKKLGFLCSRYRLSL